MSSIFRDFPDDGRYKVVVNSNREYSIWPSGRGNPLGWKDVGKTGSKSDCLKAIEEVWTDMRPVEGHRELAAQLRRRR